MSSTPRDLQSCSSVATIGAEDWRNVCSAYLMASPLVLLEDTAVIFPGGDICACEKESTVLVFTSWMSCSVGQLKRKRSKVAVQIGLFFYGGR